MDKNGIILHVVFKSSGRKVDFHIPDYYYHSLLSRKKGVLSDIIETIGKSGYFSINPDDVSYLWFSWEE